MELDLRRVGPRRDQLPSLIHSGRGRSPNGKLQDPYNVADKNAIEVRHSRGQRVGYVAKALAEKLTPLLAARKIRLAATAGPGSSFFEASPSPAVAFGPC